MAPPPPPLKFGQRQFLNDSFLSFLRRPNKSQPLPPGVPQSPDSQEPPPIPTSHVNGHGHRNDRNDPELAEKKALLQEGLQLLDSTKDMLEMSSHIIGKDTTKRYRKEAAKSVFIPSILLDTNSFDYRLTKNAPSKSKLPKKPTADIATFNQNARTLFKDVEVGTPRV